MQITNSYFTCVGEVHALETLPVPAYTRQVEARAGASAASARRKEDPGISISWTSAACFWSQKNQFGVLMSDWILQLCSALWHKSHHI